MSIQEIASAIESILFVSGDPISIVRISESLGVAEMEAAEAIKVLKNELLSEKRGISLLERDGSVLLVSRAENAPFIEASIRCEREGPLSRAALETLAIVAYRGPVSHSEVEAIRGVNSSLSLRNLLIRGLIEKSENSSGSRGFLYSISLPCLERLGLANVADLPEFENLSTDNHCKEMVS